MSDFIECWVYRFGAPESAPRTGLWFLGIPYGSGSAIPLRFKGGRFHAINGRRFDELSGWIPSGLDCAKPEEQVAVIGHHPEKMQ